MIGVCAPLTLPLSEWEWLLWLSCCHICLHTRYRGMILCYSVHMSPDQQEAYKPYCETLEVELYNSIVLCVFVVLKI